MVLANQHLSDYKEVKARPVCIVDNKTNEDLEKILDPRKAIPKLHYLHVL